MFRYNTIADDRDEIKLTVLVNDDGSFFMPSIEWTEIKDKEFPNQTLSWDHDTYIFGKFRKFLKRYILGELKKKDKKEFDDIMPILSVERTKEILEMLNLALESKWYEPKKEEHEKTSIRNNSSKK